MICAVCRLSRHPLQHQHRLLLVAAAGRCRFANNVRAAAPIRAPLQTLRAAAPARLLSVSALRRTTASDAPSAPPPSSSLAKPDFLDAAESHIWDLLVAAFAPVELSVRDISGGCGSMYGIEISSDCFRGANMLKQQRMVNAALGDLMKDWHGVQLKTRVP